MKPAELPIGHFTDLFGWRTKCSLSLFQDYAEAERGKVVVYLTTLGVLRETYARCVKVRQILRTLLIKVEERDVFMSRENQVELIERISENGGENVAVSLPQVFVEGAYLGVSVL